MLRKHWVILYKGVLAERKLTRPGAEARAFKLIKEKNWDVKEVEVKEDCY